MWSHDKTGYLGAVSKKKLSREATCYTVAEIIYKQTLSFSRGAPFYI